MNDNNLNDLIVLKDKISIIEGEILDQYLHDPNTRPWIVAFSGGKDSTMLLQVVWGAISKLPLELRSREIYVVSNDTLVENPKISRFVKRVLSEVQETAQEQNMPITVHQTTPIITESFWCKMIGRGYSPPSNVFRWCTDRLKINPTTKFIKQKVSEKGEVIILIGARSDESTTRVKSMKKHKGRGGRLRKHNLRNAFVFAPLSDVLTSEVWQYLTSVPPPWGKNNHELVTLYKNASGGECPLVIDTSTPSCGSSRFGCWVCTVVKTDRSMEALIDNGDEWMEPLLDLRDFLIEVRGGGEKYRYKEKRNEKLKKGSFGPLLPWTRNEILKRLIAAQETIQKEEKEVVLITKEELLQIQVEWERDGITEFTVRGTCPQFFYTNDSH